MTTQPVSRAREISGSSSCSRAGIDEGLDGDVVALLHGLEELRRQFRHRDCPRARSRKDSAGSLLRVLDVGLVEGVDVEHGARHRDGELEAEELGAEVGRLVELDRDLVAVGAVTRLARRGHEPFPLLARRLGDQLLEPEPEAARLVEDDLVAPGLPARAQREPELEPGVRVLHPARVVHLLRPLEQARDVDPGERRRDEPERRQRGVAAADRRLARDDLHAALGRQLLERRAGVGDDEKAVSAPADPLPEVVEMAARLDRRARLRRDDEQRVVELEPPDRRRMRRVEHLERRPVEAAEDERREARAAHPADDDTAEAPALAERLELGDPLAHPQRLVEPAEPVRLVAPRPDGRVALPDPL